MPAKNIVLLSALCVVLGMLLERHSILQLCGAFTFWVHVIRFAVLASLANCILCMNRSCLRTILLQLLLCLTIFYAVYYIMGIIFFGAFRLETYDEFMPFDFKTEPSYSSSKYKVNLISMELTYFVCGLLFAGVIKEWIWDYAITVTLIHVTVTSTIMAEFPLVWQWWLALGCAVLIMICSGQLLVHLTFQDNLIYPDLDDF